MTQNANTARLSQLGVSIWLDDLTRLLMSGGDLKKLIDTKNVVGVTTNPSIFQAAISGAKDYDKDVAELTKAGKTVEEVVEKVTTDDVREALDLFKPVYDTTGGKDGRVSIEVDPRNAHKTQETIDQAKRLWKLVDRPNLLIKIPATKAGLPAITAAIAEGISVNVTLIFSLERYKEVLDAYLTGLEQADKAGKDLSQIRSVASFFVSRVDTEVDKRLDALDKKNLKGKAAVANARVAYGAFLSVNNSARFQDLAAKGANPQRPLWASTGVKDPAYSDTMYVDDLVVADTVNTMPGKTLDAVADHSKISGDTVTDNIASAQEFLHELDKAGVDLKDVTEQLEKEGVDKFIKSWEELLEAVQEQMDASQKDA